MRREPLGSSRSRPYAMIDRRYGNFPGRRRGKGGQLYFPGLARKYLRGGCVGARGEEIIPLTTKEFALLELFLLRAPELVTRSEIVEHVWDCHFDSETNLVEVYINRLRQKVDQNRATKLIHTVRGVGYRLGVPES